MLWARSHAVPYKAHYSLGEELERANLKPLVGSLNFPRLHFEMASSSNTSQSVCKTTLVTLQTCLKWFGANPSAKCFGGNDPGA